MPATRHNRNKPRFEPYRGSKEEKEVVAARTEQYRAAAKAAWEKVELIDNKEPSIDIFSDETCKIIANYLDSKSADLLSQALPDLFYPIEFKMKDKQCKDPRWVETIVYGSDTGAFAYPDRLRKWSNVRTLRFEHAFCCFLEWLKHIPSIKYVEVDSKTSMSDEAYQHILKLPKLERLVLTYNKWKRNKCRLRRMPVSNSVQEITLSSSFDEEMKEVGRIFPNLKKATIRNEVVCSNWSIAEFPNVASLTLETIGNQRDLAEWIDNNPNLTHFEIGPIGRINSCVLVALSNCDTLRSIKYSSAYYRAGQLNLPQIHELTQVGECSLLREREIKTMVSLQKATLVSEQSFALCHHFSSLKHLVLMNMKVELQLIFYLLPPSIETLTLDHVNIIEGPFIGGISRCPNLKKVYTTNQRDKSKLSFPGVEVIVI